MQDKEKYIAYVNEDPIVCCSGINCKKREECYHYSRNAYIRSTWQPEKNYYLEDFSLVSIGCFDIENEHDYDCGYYGGYKLFKKLGVELTKEETDELKLVRMEGED